MAIQVNKISHANFYVDGVGHLGKASEVQLPKIASEDSEHKGLGMFGSLELPSGLKVLTMSVKWNGFYLEAAQKAHNMFKAWPLQVRASLETYDQSGRTAEVPVVVEAKGRWKEYSGGTLKPVAAADGYDDVLTLSAYKLKVNNVEVCDIDVLNNVYKVDGVDLLAAMRANIGG